MNKTSFVILIVIACSGVAQCQSAQQQDSVSTKPLYSILYSDGRDFVDCIALRFHEATHPDGSSLISVGIVAGTTASLFFADQSIRSIAERSHSRLNDNILTAAENYGANGNAILLSGSIYGTGLLFGYPEIRKTGTMLMESLLWTGVVTTVLKATFGRSRPYMNEGNVRFHGIQFNDHYWSFPSGHSAVAFTLSSVLSERIHNTAASIGLYSLAGMTALARVYHNDHWFSDVFLSAVIGTSVGMTVARDNEKVSTLSSFHPYILPYGFGFILEF
jgi:membrane-associated phospholipid phosphatase